MGSKKHKKHHKSERKEKTTPEAIFTTDRPAEPLRLVLKVGGSSASEHGDSPHVQPHPEVYLEDKSIKLPEKHKKSKKKKKKKSSDREKKHKHHHHHHEKKEKRKRDRSEEATMDESEVNMDQEESQEPPIKQALYDEESVPERLYREPRACTLKNRQGKSPLQHLLEYLLKNLEHKDPQQFFAWPVTDHIAPGYSSIIAHPMDFSTMRTKIENNEYPTLADFTTDLKLLCDNAMTYNRPDTIYYKAAKKMLHVGMKAVSKEKLLALKNTLPYMGDLGREELGFDTSDDQQSVGNDAIASDESFPAKEVKKKKKLEEPSKPEIGDDGMTPEEILLQARKAAKAAADKLTLRRPNSKFGFLRQQNDGSTTLAILNAGNGKDGAREERKVTLEMLVGKLQHGTGTLASFKEDKRNIGKPVKYLNYGNYGTYAPTYDSTFANLTKEESDLLYSTYGDETGVQYAESLLNFARDCDFASEMADNLLNLLTDGEHSRAMKTIDSRKKRQENEFIKKPEDKRPKTKKEEPKPLSSPALDFDFDALKSLADEGIDMSFLDSVEKQFRKDPIQKKLDETTNLLQDLAKVQTARLSNKPPAHLAHIPGPSNEELQLAAKVTESLTELSKKATPSDVVSATAIHKAMGISVEPTFQVKEEGSDMEVVENLNPSTGLPTDKGMVIESPRSHHGMGPEPAPMVDVLTQAVAEVTGEAPSPHLNLETVAVNDGMNSEEMTVVTAPALGVTADDQVGDLEDELREFLETGTALRGSDSPSQVDVSLEDVIP